MSKVDGNRRSKTGGRKKGTPNKATAEIKEMARQDAPACIEGLAKLMKHKNPWIRLAACKEMLDRGYGRPPQAVYPRESGNITVEVVRFSEPTLAQPMP